MTEPLTIDPERYAICLESGVDEQRARAISICEVSRRSGAPCMSGCGAHRTFRDGLRFAALLVRYGGSDIRTKTQIADYLDKTAEGA